MKKVYTGVVQRGAKQGSALGFPTANIPFDDPDVSGIYVATVMVDGKEYKAAAYADEKRKILESYIFDVDLDLYNKEITVVLHGKIRESATFADDDALRAAIAGDVEKVRAYFSKSP